MLMRKQHLYRLDLLSWLMMKMSRFVFAVILMLSAHRMGYAQVGLGGFNAIMTAPTAQVMPDGYAALGFGFIPSPYTLYEGPERDNLAYFASIGFLPFLEIGIRATLSLDTDHPSIGDRMLSVRAQLLKESSHFPAIGAGLHDIAGLLDRAEGTNNYFTALYLVATKTRRLSEHFSLEATLGYGVDWIPAPSHEFDDLFGGASLGFRDMLFLKGEYDARRFNAGLSVKLRESITVNLVLIDGNKVAYGANIRTRL